MLIFIICSHHRSWSQGIIRKLIKRALASQSDGVAEVSVKSYMGYMGQNKSNETRTYQHT